MNEGRIAAEQAFKSIDVRYNDKWVKSVGIHLMNSNNSFELPKDIGTQKLPDFGTSSITDENGDLLVEKPDVAEVHIHELQNDKTEEYIGIQIRFATDALFIEDEKLSREFRIPWHAIAWIDIEHFIPGEIEEEMKTSGKQ